MKTFHVLTGYGTTTYELIVKAVDAAGAMEFARTNPGFFGLPTNGVLTFLRVKEGSRTVWLPPVAMDALHKAHKKHCRNVGRRARRWLKDWMRAWLAAHPRIESIRVEIEEDEEHPTVSHFHVSIEMDGIEDETDPPFWDQETDVADALWPWGDYIHLGMKWGEYIRIHRNGKVYRNRMPEEEVFG